MTLEEILQNFNEHQNQFEDTRNRPAQSLKPVPGDLPTFEWSSKGPKSLDDIIGGEVIPTDDYSTRKNPVPGRAAVYLAPEPNPFYKAVTKSHEQEGHGRTTQSGRFYTTTLEGPDKGKIKYNSSDQPYTDIWGEARMAHGGKAKTTSETQRSLANELENLWKTNPEAAKLFINPSSTYLIPQELRGERPMLDKDGKHMKDKNGKLMYHPATKIKEWVSQINALGANGVDLQKLLPRTFDKDTHDVLTRFADYANSTLDSKDPPAYSPIGSPAAGGRHRR